MKTRTVHLHWLIDAERKSTGEIVNGEATYYYERSYTLNGQKKVLLEDREAHSATRPFCSNQLCPCHYEDLAQATILLLSSLVKSGTLTSDQANAVFHGDLPLPQLEAVYQLPQPEQEGREA